MKKKSISIFLIAILVMAFATGAGTYAASKSDLQQELSGVQAEKNDVSDKLVKVKKDIDELQPKVDSLSAEVEEANNKISQTEKKIADKKQEMKEREEGLNKRLRVMYKNGSVGFVDVLLGSNSISEFVSNLEMIQKIYENDMDVLTTLEEQEKELEKIKADLEAQRQAVSSKKSELESEMNKLDSLKGELEAKEDELNEEAKALTSKIVAMTNPKSKYVGGKFVWPVPSSHYLFSYFGWRMHPIYNVYKYHSGIDIAASTGSDILAAGSGKVIISQWYGGYGECVMIDHGGGLVTLYGHMSRRLVSAGDEVKAGQLIGKVGSTGISTGPHLHFEVRKNGEVVEPLDYVS